MMICWWWCKQANKFLFLPTTNNGISYTGIFFFSSHCTEPHHSLRWWRWRRQPAAVGNCVLSNVPQSDIRPITSPHSLPHTPQQQQHFLHSSSIHNNRQHHHYSYTTAISSSPNTKIRHKYFKILPALQKSPPVHSQSSKNQVRIKLKSNSKSWEKSATISPCRTSLERRSYDDTHIWGAEQRFTCVRTYVSIEYTYSLRPPRIQAPPELLKCMQVTPLLLCTSLSQCEERAGVSRQLAIYCHRWW